MASGLNIAYALAARRLAAFKCVDAAEICREQIMELKRVHVDKGSGAIEQHQRDPVGVIIACVKSLKFVLDKYELIEPEALEVILLAKSDQSPMFKIGDSYAATAHEASGMTAIAVLSPIVSQMPELRGVFSKGPLPASNPQPLSDFLRTTSAAIPLFDANWMIAHIDDEYGRAMKSIPAPPSAEIPQVPQVPVDKAVEFLGMSRGNLYRKGIVKGGAVDGVKFINALLGKSASVDERMDATAREVEEHRVAKAAEQWRCRKPGCDWSGKCPDDVRCPDCGGNVEIALTPQKQR